MALIKSLLLTCCLLLIGIDLQDQICGHQTKDNSYYIQKYFKGTQATPTGSLAAASQRRHGGGTQSGVIGVVVVQEVKSQYDELQDILHVLRRAECTKDDLPDTVMDELDECHSRIKPISYDDIDPYRTCLVKLFNATDGMTRNDVRRSMCYHDQVRKALRECMLEEIRNSAAMIVALQSDASCFANALYKQTDSSTTEASEATTLPSSPKTSPASETSSETDQETSEETEPRQTSPPTPTPEMLSSSPKPTTQPANEGSTTTTSLSDQSSTPTALEEEDHIISDGD